MINFLENIVNACNLIWLAGSNEPFIRGNICIYPIANMNRLMLRAKIAAQAESNAVVRSTT